MRMGLHHPATPQCLCSSIFFSAAAPVLGTAPLSTCWAFTGGTESFVTDVLKLDVTLHTTRGSRPPLAMIYFAQHPDRAVRAFATLPLALCFPHTLTIDVMHDLHIALHSPDTVGMMLHERLQGPDYDSRSGLTVAGQYALPQPKG